MKIAKISMLLLASGLFLASCGNSETTDETTTMDTMATAPMAEEAPMPATDTAMMTTDTTMPTP